MNLKDVKQNKILNLLLTRYKIRFFWRPLAQDTQSSPLMTSLDFCSCSTPSQNCLGWSFRIGDQRRSLWILGVCSPAQVSLVPTDEIYINNFEFEQLSTSVIPNGDPKTHENKNLERGRALNGLLGIAKNISTFWHVLASLVLWYVAD